MKVCRICNKKRPLNLFHKHAKAIDGLDKRCKVCCSKNKKDYYLCKKEYIDTRSKKYNNKNKEARKERAKNYYLNNKEKILRKCKIYAQKTKTQRLERQKLYQRKRAKEDPLFKLKITLRRRMWSAVKKGLKTGSAIADLGCSVEFLKQYLESRFQPGMTWENWTRDGWHIDHILPLSSFDLTDREQYKKAAHYTNLQPLWAEDNYRKHDSICLTNP